MTHETRRFWENLAQIWAATTVICFIAYLVIVKWWVGYMEFKNSEELARHESCYVEWGYNQTHQEHYLWRDYCGGAVP